MAISSRVIRPVMAITAFILGALALAFLATMWIRPEEPAARRLLLERFSHLSLGDTRDRVEDVLGRPRAICSGPEGLYPHQMPGRFLFFDRNTADWKALAEKTAERWIYPLPTKEEASVPAASLERREPCQPRYVEGEVGFDETGAVLWFIALTDEDYVTYR